MSFSEHVLQHLMDKVLSEGTAKGILHVTAPNGRTITYKGNESGQEVDWRIKDWRVVKAVASRGDIGFGETYAQGLWETNDLEGILRFFIDNIDEMDRYANGHLWSRCWFYVVNHLLRRNSIKGSQSNIRSHYDVGNDFYGLWLDKSMTYSSGIFGGKPISLEEAQIQKYQRILERIEPSRKSILEIGCGWGGFAEMAISRGHTLKGLTVSPQQQLFATNRLKGGAQICLQDYRREQGTFDAIASIEMFEAVGIRYWPAYFSTLKKCLAKDGVAMVQTITIRDDAFDHYIKQSDYIRHYIFPGGLLPSVTKFKEYAEQAGLTCRDIYLFGEDYATTLKEWRRRFTASDAAIRALGHNDEFIRSWDMYLSMCAASFGNGRTNVMQVELVHA
ncbi:MAG: class I SAM-dependent methyltransferase [Alphaproteobacteria bacterium]|nr:class I SAM-dependent methyltransferase [Alphaproteobacteria bacterium]